MLHLDTILSQYPDETSRLLLLSQALDQTRTDLAALRHTLAANDRQAALKQVHQAKGTASFLGSNQASLRSFDQLTYALRETPPDTSPHSSTKTIPPGIQRAFARVESVLRHTEHSLQDRIHARKKHNYNGIPATRH